MNNHKGYNLLVSHLVQFVMGVWKCIKTTFAFILMNAPLLISLAVFNIESPSFAWALVALLSVTIYPSLIYVTCYMDRDMSLLKTFKLLFSNNLDSIIKITLIFHALICLIVVDIVFFIQINQDIVAIIFGALLMLTIIFMLNTIQVIIRFKSKMQQLLLVSYAYTKELACGSICSFMTLFVLGAIAIVVTPLAGVLMIGIGAAVHNWFSVKAQKMMQDRISRIDILEY